METSQSLKEIYAINFDCSIHTLVANSTLYLKKEEAKSCRRFSALEIWEWNPRDAVQSC